MKNILLKLFQILSVIMLIFLSISTFIPQNNNGNELLFLDRFYDSPLNLALWITLALIILSAVIFKGIKTPRQKILHIALVVIIILFIFDKANNERTFITLREGEAISLKDHILPQGDIYDIDLSLERFELEKHDDEQTPKAYRSYLQIDSKPVELAVNKPLAIGHYRLYQSAFEKHYFFDLQVGNEHVEVTFGDTLMLAEGTVMLDDYNSRIKHFRLIINNQTQWLPLNSPIMINNIEWRISPIGEVYSSVIEVVEVRGLFWLLLAGILYLAFMAWDFWKPKKQQEETK